MQLALIGVGRVGGAVVDSLAAYERLFDGGVATGTVAVDTAPADLASLRAVPRQTRITVGAAYPCRDGVGGDNELGASIVAEDIDRVLAGVDCLPSHHVDAFVVVAALGGGTGGGGAPVVARELGRLFSRPVYGLGVLPGTDADGATARRTVRSLVTFVREVDNLLLVAGVGDRRRVDAAELARRLVVVFGTDWSARAVLDGRLLRKSREADALDTLDTLDSAAVPPATEETNGAPDDAPPVFDTDAAVTLETVLEAGTLSILGYATVPPRRRQRTLADRVRRLATRSTPQTTDSDVVRAVRAAIVDGVTGDPPRAERAWLVITGPRRALSRPECDVGRGRTWLRATTGASAVGGRTLVTDDGPLTATVVLAAVRDVRRLTALWEQAVAARAGRDDAANHSAEATERADRTFDPLF